MKERFKIKSLIELYDYLPEGELLLVDVLRQIAIDSLNGYGKEKISYNVPFFHGNKSICLIWPASVPRGGIKSGVMFSFWYGNRLKDVDNYLTHGTNKQIFYKIYHSVDEIDEIALRKLMQEAIELDKSFKNK